MTRIEPQAGTKFADQARDFRVQELSTTCAQFADLMGARTATAVAAIVGHQADGKLDPAGIALVVCNVMAANKLTGDVEGDVFDSEGTAYRTIFEYHAGYCTDRYVTRAGIQL